MWRKCFNLRCSHFLKMHLVYAFLLLLQFPAQSSSQNFLNNCFPQDEMDGENYDLFYQNSIRKYEDDLEH